MPLEPPEPIEPSNLPSLLSGLTWTAVAGQYNAAGSALGHFTNPLTGGVSYLVSGHGTAADGAWAVQTTLNTGTHELLFTSADATVMQGGTVSSGVITYGGHTYVGRVYWDATAGWIKQLLQTS